MDRRSCLKLLGLTPIAPSILAAKESTSKPIGLDSALEPFDPNRKYGCVFYYGRQKSKWRPVFQVDTLSEAAVLAGEQLPFIPKEYRDRVSVVHRHPEYFGRDPLLKVGCVGWKYTPRSFA